MDAVPLYRFRGEGRLAALAVDYQPGYSENSHCHDSAQLLHATSGLMRVTTASGYWVVPPGRGIWIPPYVAHQIDMVGAVSMRTLYVAESAAGVTPSTCIVVEVSPLLRELISSMAAAGGNGSITPARRKALEDLALIELETLQGLPFNVPLPREPRLRRLCNLSLENLGSSRSFEELAEESGASVRTLRRLFCKEVGMSFAAWRQQARLVEGLARLAAGQPVRTVAAMLGYDSPSAFTAMVKRIMGAPPSQLAAHARARTPHSLPRSSHAFDGLADIFEP